MTVLGERRHRWIVGSLRSAPVLVVLGVVLAGCTSSGGGSGAGTSESPPGAPAVERHTIAMVTHAAPGQSFFDLIRRGAEAAAAKDDIDLRYSADIQGPNQATLVQDAVDSGVDGIAVTLARPDQLAGAVAAATAAGIPVVAFNSGIDDWRTLGALEYFGQDERLASQAVGRRIAEEGGRKAICVIHDQGQVALESRCAGVRDGLAGGSVENVNVTGTDMPSVEAAITTRLGQDPSIDHVVTLGAPFALTAVQAVADTASAAKVVTFDTDSAVVDAIEGGTVQWAVDQQPFLQGYLAVDALWLYLQHGTVIGGGQPTLTGPSFVDQSNIDAIAEFARAGTR
jgi:simple sugar transport system substrate-binding protein